MLVAELCFKVVTEVLLSINLIYNRTDDVEDLHADAMLHCHLLNHTFFLEKLMDFD